MPPASFTGDATYLATSWISKISSVWTSRPEPSTTEEPPSSLKSDSTGYVVINDQSPQTGSEIVAQQDQMPRIGTFASADCPLCHKDRHEDGENCQEFELMKEIARGANGPIPLRNLEAQDIKKMVVLRVHLAQRVESCMLDLPGKDRVHLYVLSRGGLKHIRRAGKAERHALVIVRKEAPRYTCWGFETVPDMIGAIQSGELGVDVMTGAETIIAELDLQLD